MTDNVASPTMANNRGLCELSKRIEPSRIKFYEDELPEAREREGLGAGSQTSLRDELTVHVCVHRFQPAFRSITRILYAPEGRFRQCKTHVIDGHHAAFDGRSDQVGGLGRLGPRIGCEPVR